VGVSHWSAHVQARTDLLKGRISEKTMNAVWDRTRKAGPGDLKRFETALRQHHGKQRCHDLRNISKVPRSQQDAVTGCVTRSRIATEAVAAAQAVIGDWRDHLKHMAAYADGGMTAGKAQRLWVQAWRNAPANISTYAATGTKLRKAPPCERAR
ncbi:MAG TPA: hypothetical protein VGP44_12365, partial [Gemmatimonadales bacterium]|nr:hypothetical protein [Gemmatimonadales bacterium]